MLRISACTMDCPDACSLLVDPAKGTIAGNPEHPFTRGFVCPKGARFFSRLRHPDRIIKPMLRKKGGGFTPVSWDVALDLCAEKIDALRATPERILHLRGFGYRGVLAKASNVFFRALGAAELTGSLCDEAGIAACEADFGILDHNDPLDLLNASAIVNWGKDFSRSSIHTAALVREARKKGTEVLTISPGCDGNDELSDARIRIRPGTDRFLAAAVIRLMLEAGGVESRLAAACDGFAAFRDLVEGQSLTDLCAACGVHPDQAGFLYDWYAAPGAVATVIGWGVQRHVRGGQNVRFINALAFLSGQVGKSGGGAYYNISSGRNLGDWGGPGRRPARFYSKSLLALDLEQADPKPGFVWIDGFNPANQVPDCGRAAKALEQCGFVVTVEGFFNDTALRSHLVLPPAFMLEHEDILGSCLHNVVNHSARVVDAPGECRSDFDILADLGGRLSPAVTFPPAEECLAQGLATPWLDVSLDELRARGFAQAKRRSVAFADLVFGHPDGLYRFPNALDAEPPAPANWPFRLLTLVRRRYLHSQIPPAEQDGPPPLWVSPDSPALAGLDMTAPVRLVTPLGSMPVRLEPSPDLEPGTLVLRRGGWMLHGLSPNIVIEARTTDMGGGAAYYSQFCRLENA